MPQRLPKPIAAYFAAEKTNDFDALSKTFSRDGEVRDESHIFAGRGAIAQWMKDAKAKYKHRAEVVGAVLLDGVWDVSAKTSGDFPGSPIVLHHRFKLRGDEIAVLVISV
jgi:hypothetical protein